MVIFELENNIIFENEVEDFSWVVAVLFSVNFISFFFFLV